MPQVGCWMGDSMSALSKIAASSDVADHAGSRPASIRLTEGPGPPPVQPRKATHLTNVDDFYVEADAGGKWEIALAAAHPAAPARICLLTDSLGELVGPDGFQAVWPHRLSTPGWRYIPVGGAWGFGTYNFPGGDTQPPMSEVLPASGGPTPVSPTTGQTGIRLPQVILDAAGEYVHFDVSRADRVRLFYSEVWAVYAAPEVALDSGSFASVSASVWNDNCYVTAEFDVSEVDTFRVQKGSAGNASINGILARFGTDSAVSVLNLARTSSRVTDWTSWLQEVATGSIYRKLMIGYDPHLVVLPSGGNDFFEGVPDQTTWHNRLNALRSLVLSYVPDADFAIPTNPPRALTGWDTFNTWTRNWATANDVSLLDWEAKLSAAGASDAWYLSDGLHFRFTTHGRVADYARESLLKIWR